MSDAQVFDYIYFHRPENAQRAERMHAVAKTMLQRFDEDVEVANGVARWKATGRVPDSMAIDFWASEGKLTPLIANDSKCQAQSELERFQREVLSQVPGRHDARVQRPLQEYVAPRFPFEFIDAERTLNNFSESATVSGGVVRWNSNNRVPPSDCLQLWAFCNCKFDYLKSLEVGKRELGEFLSEVRKQDAGREISEEEIATARAAYGPGVDLMNVITGRKFRT
jgi:hypothetical protein